MLRLGLGWGFDKKIWWGEIIEEVSSKVLNWENVKMFILRFKDENPEGTMQEYFVAKHMFNKNKKE